jgi:hypothetical protein
MEYELRLVDTGGEVLERVSCATLADLGTQIWTMGDRFRRRQIDPALDVYGGGVSLQFWCVEGAKERRLNEGQRARAFEAAQAAGVVLIRPPRIRSAVGVAA